MILREFPSRRIFRRFIISFRIKQRYYARILFFLAVASLVPTVWLAGFLYQRISALIRTSEENQALHYLEQISHTTNLVLKNMEDTVHLLRMNSEFTNYQQLGDKEYFSRFLDHYNLERISEYSRFLKLRAGINRNLEQFATTSEFIQSVYFFDPQVREVFSLEFIPSPIQSFVHREWYEELPGMEDRTLIGPVLNKSRQEVLYLVFPELRGSEMVFIININLQAFYEFLWKQIQPRDTEMFFILDDAGNPIVYDTGRSKRVHTLAWAMEKRDSGLREVMLDNESLIVSSLGGNLNGWTYHAENNRENFSYIFVQNRRFMGLVLIPLLLINLVLLFLLRKVLYSPITRVISHTGVDDLATLRGLERWIDETLDEKRNREELLSSAIPGYCKNYIRKMLGNREGKRDLQRPPGLPFSGGKVRVTGFFPASEDDWDKTESAVESWAGSLECGFITVKRDDILFLIIDCLSLPYDDLCKQIDRFLIGSDLEDGLRIYGAAGRDCRTLEELYEGRMQVETSLKDYMKVPFGTPVIELGRPGSGDLSPLQPDGEFYDELLNLLREESVEPAWELMEYHLTELHSAMAEWPAEEVQHFHINMISSLLMRLKDRGTEGILSKPGHENLFVSLVKLRTRDSLFSWVRDLMLRINVDLKDDGNDRKSRSYVGTAETLIEQQLGEDISLSLIAEQMGLSTFYLSRLFREVRDESFTDYLKMARMKKARLLLEDPASRVKDVSRQVGYWSSNYFIKVFRKHYGVTPGEFRKTLMKRNSGPSEPADSAPSPIRGDQ